MFPPDVVQLNITPPAARAYAALQAGTPLDCSDCARCGHSCGLCGPDTSHSATPIVSPPLQRLRLRYTQCY
ncbi:hypothetical protein [Janthinobacterium sp. RB2P8]|uniref:hypothetical protein n=1 Tax=Janthinobacterium sp. RB2P8 TaxID=3424191 RepID=UPI003F293F4E